MNLAEKCTEGVFAIYYVKGSLAAALKDAEALSNYLHRETSGAAIEVKKVGTDFGPAAYMVTLHSANRELLDEAVHRMEIALSTLDSLRIARQIQTTMFKAA